MEFKKIDILSSPREEWILYHKFRKLYHLENTPDEPYMEDNKWEESDMADYKNSLIDMEYNNYRILDSHEIIGTFNFRFYKETSSGFEGNGQIVKFEIEILKKYHRQGLGTQALSIMYHECSKFNKTIFISERQNFLTKPFFIAVGANIVQTLIKNRLDLDRIDFDILNKWVTEGELRNRETRIIIQEGKIPEEIALEFAKSFNDSVQHIPRDGIAMVRTEFGIVELRRMEKINDSGKVKSIYVIAIEKSGEISGITNVRIIPSNDELLYQAITGVPMSFRGRKLGKLIKAKMVLYIKEKYPNAKYIITDNAETNDSMLNINRKLGYKKFKELLSFQVDKQHLQSYLQSKNM